MQTGEEIQISEFSANLNKTYNWFDENFKNILSESIKEFWGEDTDIKLINVSENQSFFAQGEEFFVTQIRLNKELSVFIRLSKTLVKNLLEMVLGTNGKVFKIDKLSELEVKILTSFDNFLFKNFSHLVKDAESLNKTVYDFNECHLVFTLKKKDFSLGKFVIKIPIAAIEPELLAVPEKPSFDIDDFLDLRVPVSLYAGYSKIKLSELKHLEKDDIVLLEDSNYSKMILRFNNQDIEFDVNPNPAIMTDYDIDENNVNSEGEFNMGNEIYNMWDTIQVEIGAEFEKVKLSLGELKQISEGLIVDIGSVYDNKIDLKVEEKIVASGELVIINDRYGVKINKVYTDDDNKTQETENNIEPEYPEENFEENQEVFEEEVSKDDYEDQIPQQENYANDSAEVSEDDFDYSGFDVDEEDI